MHALPDETLAADKIRLIMKLRRAGIRDSRVLGAMEQIPRELFVPASFQDRAYDDTALPIDDDQTISQPTIVAWMTMCLEVSDRHVVLEVGTGSGYQAAILAKLARRIHTIERHSALYETAKQQFDFLKLRNITPHLGDGSKGWPHAAPYDRIMVTAAANQIPQALLEQLAPGGVMVIPVGESVASQQLMRIRKDEAGCILEEELMAVRFVPLVEES